MIAGIGNEDASILIMVEFVEYDENMHLVKSHIASDKLGSECW